MAQNIIPSESSSNEMNLTNQSDDAKSHKRLLKLLEHQLAVNTDPCVLMELSESDILNLGCSLDILTQEEAENAYNSETVRSSSILVSDTIVHIPSNVKIKIEPGLENTEDQNKDILEQCESTYDTTKNPPTDDIIFHNLTHKIVQKSEYVVRMKGVPYRYVLYVNVENKQQLLQCKACQECFNSKGELLYHFKDETEDHSCRYQRENHNIRTLEEIFQCNICEKLFGNEVIFLEHANMHDNTPTLLTEPRKKFLKFVLMKEGSTDEAEPAKYFECETCQKCFTDLMVFLRHQRYHSKNRPYKCEECKKQFARLGDLKRHKLTHKGEKPFSCHVCNFAFTRQADLQRHFQTHTGYKPFECHLCVQRFGRQADLNRHQFVHAREKAFKCNVCGKGFHRRPDLEKHGLKHTGKRPYKCKDCNKSFIHELGLKRHILHHRENRPFPCEYCERSYMNEASFEKHKLKHSFNKVFSCFICNKNFCYQSELSRHFTTHSGQKEYECDVCKKCFSRRFDVIRHRKIHGWWSGKNAKKIKKEVDSI